MPSGAGLTMLGGAGIKMLGGAGIRMLGGAGIKMFLRRRYEYCEGVTPRKDACSPCSHFWYLFLVA